MHKDYGSNERYFFSMYNRRKYLDRKSHIAWMIISILNYLVMLGVVGEKLDYLVPNDYERSLVNLAILNMVFVVFVLLIRHLIYFILPFFTTATLKLLSNEFEKLKYFWVPYFILITVTETSISAFNLVAFCTLAYLIIKF